MVLVEKIEFITWQIFSRKKVLFRSSECDVQFKNQNFVENDFF